MLATLPPPAHPKPYPPPPLTCPAAPQVMLHTYERRRSQREVINEMPLYPTEGVLWDESQIPSVNYTGEGCLALPKLNLQFLTPHDYLLRNFHLFRWAGDGGKGGKDMRTRGELPVFVCNSFIWVACLLARHLSFCLPSHLPACHLKLLSSKPSFERPRGPRRPDQKWLLVWSGDFHGSSGGRHTG